jgi:hypothetical protein
VNRGWPEGPAPWGHPAGGTWGTNPSGTSPSGAWGTGATGATWGVGPVGDTRGTGPVWPAPPPPTHRSLTWLWVLLAFFAVAGIAAIVAIVAFVNAVRPPVDAMNHYLAAVDHANYDVAYSYLCDAEQARTPREQFPAAIQPFERRLFEYDVYSFDPVGRERTVQYRITDFGGEEHTYRATMVREHGAWRVCDFFNDSDRAA